MQNQIIKTSDKGWISELAHAYKTKQSVTLLTQIY
jgi:hypothetical protein